MNEVILLFSRKNELVAKSILSYNISINTIYFVKIIIENVKNTYRHCKYFFNNDLEIDF